MYLTTVDSASFQELKQEQALNVTFAGFIENLVHILQDCQQGKLEISLVQGSSMGSSQHNLRVNETSNSPISSESTNHTMQHYQLQFVEIRPFKNLVHLSLPCRLAPLNVVLFYLNNILDSVQVIMFFYIYTLLKVNDDSIFNTLSFYGYFRKNIWPRNN